MTILLALLLAGQTTPIPPLPKGTALPPPAEETAVLAPLTTLLTAIAAHDGPAILSATLPEGRATAVPDGTTAVKPMPWSDFAAGVAKRTDRIEERITDPAIEIDGDMAMIWAPYVMFKDGTPLHCGTNHVDLVRTAGVWKVLNVTWSARTTGCTR